MISGERDMSTSADESLPQATTQGELASRSLRKELGLRDLVPMQILLVVGIFPAGIAAHQGGTHVLLWLLSVALLLLPAAALVQFCVKIWPFEGGVYQWTRHTIGPFAGFLCAWNLGAYFLLIISNLGILTASSLSYGLGPSAAWMVDSRGLITGLNLGLFAFIFLINIPGLGIGRWVAHLGTGIILMVTALLLILLFLHPHSSPVHPHVSPQAPFSFGLPVLTLLVGSSAGMVRMVRASMIDVMGSEYIESTMTRVSGSRARMIPVASMPFSPGIKWSMRMMSGVNFAATRTAARPSGAQATTSMSFSALINMLNPSETTL